MSINVNANGVWVLFQGDGKQNCQSPKSETRNPKEIPSPKSEKEEPAISNFRTIILSDFGLRIWDFVQS
jgi:hypothetical protein